MFKENDIGNSYYNRNINCNLCQKKDIPYCKLNSKIVIDYSIKTWERNIILTIVDNHRPNIRKPLSTNTISTNDLVDCVNFFTAFNELENYNCSNYRKTLTVLKRIVIPYPPRILMIQLKRFKILIQETLRTRPWFTFFFN